MNMTMPYSQTQTQFQVIIDRTIWFYIAPAHFFLEIIFSFKYCMVDLFNLSVLFVFTIINRNFDNYIVVSVCTLRVVAHVANR